MLYTSTRGEAPEIGFCDALLTGLAADGGLYVPKQWPVFSRTEIEEMRGLPYQELALRVMQPFTGGEIPDEALRRIIAETYATFRHDAICPIVQTANNEFILELFHGPTLAFKDVAMQLLARLMDHVLGERGERATIVGATSGDTGGAAVDAFAGRDRTDIFILFPHGRVSPVQQRQMTTCRANNVHALAIEGSFDDCQRMVKGMFADTAFRDAVRLSGVNSINWGRIMAQIVYFFYSALALGAPSRTVSFVVPTGNFGDIFAGFAAAKMGLPIGRLVIATNENDILSRTLASGRYETRQVVSTTSPSMDIQVSSNFERLIFEAGERDHAAVRSAMENLRQSGAFTVEAGTLRAIRRDFAAGSASVGETASTINAVYEGSGYLCDPHTAVAVKVAREFAGGAAPDIILATAHPAKFPQAVREACGIEPALPGWLGDLMDREEKYTVLAPEAETVQLNIREKARICAKGVRD